DVAHCAQRRGVDGASELGAVLLLHVPGRAHDGVGALVHVGGDVVVGLLDGVGQDEGAGHERDAEEDGGRGQQEPHLVGLDGADREREHQMPPSVRMRSRTEPALGSMRSSTMRPSARNTARSAYEAATGSWVTITMVSPNSRTA